MTILNDIRDDLVTESASLSNTLRKAKILAHQLGVPEFQHWVDSELVGYADASTLPSYRRFPATNLGTFAGVTQMVRNTVLPTYGLPEPVKDYAENRYVHQGVGELEGMLATDSETFQKRWPNEFVQLSQQAIQMSNGMILVEAHQPIPRSLISGVLDNVKNKLLDFVLGLQNIEPSVGDPEANTVSTGEVRNLMNVYIYGNHNIVASGEKVHQEVSQVERGDVDSLIKHFQQLGIEDSDLQDLKCAVSAEPASANGTFGPLIERWIGRMLAKAGTGIWTLSTSDAAEKLLQGLSRFYGIS